MNQNRASRPVRQSAAGFTLIEIMVVVLIIGLLAAVVVPNLDFIWKDQQIKKAEVDVKSIENAVRMHKMSKGKLPEELATLAEKDAKGDSLLSELQQDPWGNDYRLVINTQSDWYVMSMGPDGSEGGDDDIQAGPGKDKEK